MAALVITNQGLTFDERTAAGGSLVTSKSFKGGHDWLRLVRQGSTITAYYSSDGVTYKTAGSMGWSTTTPLYAGFEAWLNSRRSNPSLDQVQLVSTGPAFTTTSTVSNSSSAPSSGAKPRAAVTSAISPSITPSITFAATSQTASQSLTSSPSFVPQANPDFNQTFFNDVNVSNGSVHISSTDLSLPAIGGPVTFTRNYDSLNNYDLGMGQGWSYTDDDRLAVQNSGAVEWTDSAGHQALFTENTDPNYYFLPPGATGSAMANLPNGQVIVAGTYNVIGGTRIALTRLNADGSVDTTFNPQLGGFLYTFAGDGNAAQITCVTAQSDGKIVVGGFENVNGIYSYLITRFNSDGTLDTTFGGHGNGSISIPALLNGDDTASVGSIAIDNLGNIVAIGTEASSSTSSAVAFRLTSAGALDSTFPTLKLTVAGDPGDIGTSVVVTPDNHYVFGFVTDTTPSDNPSINQTNFSVYDSSGHLDGTISGTAGSTNANRLALAAWNSSTQRLVVLNTQANGSNTNYLIQQYSISSAGVPTLVRSSISPLVDGTVNNNAVLYTPQSLTIVNGSLYTAVSTSNNGTAGASVYKFQFSAGPIPIYSTAPLTNQDSAASLAVSSNGTVYTIGTGHDPTTSYSDSSTLSVFNPNLTLSTSLNGTYNTPLGLYGTLVKTSVGGWVYTDKTGTQRVFNSSGQLTEVLDRFGNGQTISYSGSTTTITDLNDPHQQLVLSFNSDSTPHLTQVTDSTGRVYTYTYGSVSTSAGSVTEPTLATLSSSGNAFASTTYAYDSGGSSTGFLTTITDPVDSSVHFGYNEGTSKLASLKDALKNNNPYTLSFNSSKNQTTIKDPRGNSTVYTFNAVGDQTAAAYPDGSSESAVWQNYLKLSDTTAAGTETFSYDSQGNITQSQNRDGTVTLSAFDPTFNQPLSVTVEGGAGGTDETTLVNYNAFGAPISTENSVGYTTTDTPNSKGQVTSTTTPLGQTTFYTYNSDGELTQKLVPLGNGAYATYSATYDRRGDLLTQTDADGNTTTYTYDLAGRPLTRTDALGNSTTATYDAAGDLLTSTDGRTLTTDYAYNADHDLTLQTDPANATISYTYDANGNQLTKTDARGNTTSYVYDAMNRVVSVIRPSGGTNASGQPNTVSITHRYDLAGNITETIDVRGNPTYMTYDALGHMLTSKDELGNTTSYAYDAFGNMTQMVDPDTNVTQYRYDSLNRQTKVIDGLTHSSYTYYDPDGKVTATVDADGNETRYAYDSAGRLTLKFDGLSNPTSFAYDPEGNLTLQIDPDHHATTYQYDKDNRQTQITDALGYSQTISYDADSNKIQIAKQVGTSSEITTYAYNKDNLLTLTIDPLSNHSSAAYDLDGNLTQVTDGDQNTRSISYDPLGRPTLVIDGLGTGRTTTAYDNAGNITRVTDGNGNSTTYAYDLDNRRTLTIVPLSGSTYAITTTAYDPAGNVTMVTDPRGNSTTVAYDADNRATLTTVPLASTPAGIVYALRTTAYDPAGNVTMVTDPLGNSTTKSYDADNRVTLTVNPLTRTTAGIAYATTTTAYDPAGNITMVTDPLGNARTTVYDADNRPTLTIDALTSATFATTTTAYDALGDVTLVTDPLRHTTSTAYDLDNRPTLTIDGNNNPTTTAYDAVGNVTSVTDGNHNTTTYAYDLDNRRTLTIVPLSSSTFAITTTAYDLVGNVTLVTGPLAGQATTIAYDKDNRPTLKADALHNSTTTVYDAAGNIVLKTDPLKRTSTTYAYDLANREALITDQLGNKTSQIYDADGNVIESVTPRGYATTNAYDLSNRLTLTIDPLQGSTSKQYDADGNLIRETDPNNNVSSYTYDDAHRNITDSDPLGTRTYAYDADGNLTFETDRDGRQQSFTYDADNNETADIWLSGTGGVLDETTWQYDADNNTTAVGDSNSAYSYTYDADNRVSGETYTVASPVPVVTNYTFGYDAAGNQTSETIQNPSTGVTIQATTTTYDLDNRETQVQQSSTAPGMTATQTVSFTYDKDGELVTESRTSGSGPAVTSTYKYDADGRVINLIHTAGSTPINSFTYTYDPDSNELTATSVDGTDSYTYDADDQETGATHSGPGQSNEVYTYDSNGNRTDTNYATGSDNTLTSDGTNNYNYDAEGNLIRSTNIATGAVTLHKYDYHNQLIEVQQKTAGGTVTSDALYTYDALGNRITKSVSTNGGAPVITQFIYDGKTLAAQLSATGQPTHIYLNGTTIDSPISDQSSTGTNLWLLTDNQGTVRDLVDFSGTPRNHIVYNSFGQVVSQTNVAYQTVFGYTGQQTDAETGLDYDRARYYDPADGRFISQDPLSFAGGDTNLYRYADNSPSNGSDPTGLSFWDSIAGGFESLGSGVAHFVEGASKLVAGAVIGTVGLALATLDIPGANVLLGVGGDLFESGIGNEEQAGVEFSAAGGHITGELLRLVQDTIGTIDILDLIQHGQLKFEPPLENLFTTSLSDRWNSTNDDLIGGAVFTAVAESIVGGSLLKVAGAGAGFVSDALAVEDAATASASTATSTAAARAAEVSTVLDDSEVDLASAIPRAEDIPASERTAASLASAADSEAPLSAEEAAAHPELFSDEFGFTHMPSADAATLSAAGEADAPVSAYNLVEDQEFLRGDGDIALLPPNEAAPAEAVPTPESGQVAGAPLSQTAAQAPQTSALRTLQANLISIVKGSISFRVLADESFQTYANQYLQSHPNQYLSGAFDAYLVADAGYSAHEDQIGLASASKGEKLIQATSDISSDISQDGTSFYIPGVNTDLTGDNSSS
jgi:RHS repeat-associated protein/uncharacterized delta-60 repeat protein